MNARNAKDYLVLVQALADGKTIQFMLDGAWIPVANTDFHLPPEFYRVKPEPRRWTLLIGLDNKVVGDLRSMRGMCSDQHCVEVVEVLK